MKKIFNSTLVLMITLVLFSCTEDSFNLKGYPDSVVNDDPAGSPPRGIVEKWNNHSDLLNRKYFDSYIAVYYGDEVNREIEWPYTFISDSWKFVIDNYGNFGDEGSRLYAAIHQDLNSDSYISTYFDEISNFQSLIDISLEGGEIDTNNKDKIVFLIEKLVENSVKGVKGAIGEELWKDQFAKIFVYDMYKAVGLDDDAQRIYNNAITEEVSYPSANTFWFKDWFLPLYETYNGTVIFSNFYKLLSEKYPLEGNSYARDLNLGEMIHFFSGASGVDLQPLAETAFGWNNEYEELLFQAKAKFPDMNYPFDPVTEVVDVTNQGALSVSRDNNGGPSHKEGSPKVVDGDIGSKFLVRDYPDPIWIQLQYAEPVAISQYSISSANDAPDRDPRKWELEASNDGINWTSLHTKENESFSQRHQTKTYSFSNEQKFTHYRLHILENSGSGLMQVAEIRFFSVQEIRELDYTIDATLTVSRENVNGADGAEGSLKAIDGNIGTKFLVGDFPNAMWMQQELAEPKIITKYTITSADDANNRDPKDWELLGSNDGNNWTLIDTQTDQSFPNRHQTATYTVSNNTEYLYYRINISKNNGSDAMQLSEWRLLGPR